jgi:hypothetical protein
MPLARHQFGGETAGTNQLLALPEMRRRVQSGVVVGFVAKGIALSDVFPASLASLSDTVDQLTDLITALDRRLPQVQRTGESAIADAALRLRSEATKRITEIEQEIVGRQSLDSPPTSV